MSLRIALASLTLSLAACLPAQSASSPTISLRMKGSPANASVTVDDQIVGPLDVVQAKGVALPPGKHRVTVEAAGYLPKDVMVEAKDAPVLLDVVLVPIPE